MDNRIQKYIKRIYIDKDYDFFREQSRLIPEYTYELINKLKPFCINLKSEGIENKKLPRIEIVCDVEQYKIDDFNAEYETVIKISKVANAFILYHQFRIDNKDPNSLFPILKGENWSGFTSLQDTLEEVVVRYLSDKNVLKIDTNEFEQVVTGLIMPENNLSGQQMTVGLALFHDIFGICC